MTRLPTVTLTAAALLIVAGTWLASALAVGWLWWLVALAALALAGAVLSRWQAVPSLARQWSGQGAALWLLLVGVALALAAAVRYALGDPLTGAGLVELLGGFLLAYALGAALWWLVTRRPV